MLHYYNIVVADDKDDARVCVSVRRGERAFVSIRFHYIHAHAPAPFVPAAKCKVSETKCEGSNRRAAYASLYNLSAKLYFCLYPSIIALHHWTGDSAVDSGDCDRIVRPAPTAIKRRRTRGEITP